MYKKYFKRALDLLFSFLLITLLFPVLAMLTGVCFFLLREHPLFLQNRTGLNGKHFTIIKFKTMRTLRNESGVLLHDDLRITPATKLIRQLNLDELPQLINIIRGDMSFIGPRPLPIRYDPLYSPTQFKRHSVRPGITGLAQVNGRKTVSGKNRSDLDLVYCNTFSFAIDAKILYRTLFVFFDRSLSELGINQDPESYLPDFEN